MKLSAEIEVLKKNPEYCIDKCDGAIKDDGYCHAFKERRNRTILKGTWNHGHFKYNPENFIRTPACLSVFKIKKGES